MKKIIKIVVTVIFSILAIFFLICLAAVGDVTGKIVFFILAAVFITGIIIINGGIKNIPIFSSKYKERIIELENTISDLNQKLAESGYPDYENLRNLIHQKEQELNELDNRISLNRIDISNSNATLTELSDKEKELEKKIGSQTKKLQRLKELYSSINYSIKNYYKSDTHLIDQYSTEEVEALSPSVILKLHHMDIMDLRRAFKDNDKIIAKTLVEYESRYTTKANKTIYQLLVIALKAELQNILYNLRYEKLDKAVDSVKTMTSKYLKIAGEGNQAILPTLVRFIGEIEYLFINSVKIEYNYYVKREQQKQEQAALREQMRQEAEERKALEAERKKIEQEEQKFNSEIEKLQTSMTAATDPSELEALRARILELQSQLSDVITRKEDVTRLQNGKAGNVYIISNLGSFGEDVFKIGMTRRLEPQDRVNELGSASVPFKFDVHSFIFSDDAVMLENSLHRRLNSKRVNKVNLRKEFFRIPIDELEKLVNEIDPTAEFNKAMIAEEYNQSLSTDEVYDNSETGIYEDDDEME
jgi:phage protein